MTTLISYEARKAVQVGYDNHWRFRVVGQGDVPERSYYKKEWVYEAVEAPQKGLDRIETLRRSGISIKGFVVAHEAPKLLTAPAPKKDFKNTTPVILPDIGKVVSSLAMGLLWFITLIFQVALLDPALIVVLEDGTWLEVMTWYE